ADLFESTAEFCGRLTSRTGLDYTAAMIAVGLSLCLNVLSLVNLLWVLGVLQNPYGYRGTLHPRHYVYALVYGGLIANSVLARFQLRGDGIYLRLIPCVQPRKYANRRVAPCTSLLPQQYFSELFYYRSCDIDNVFTLIAYR